MFWFKNLMAYSLTKDLELSKLEEALQQCRYTECVASDVSKFGWIAPLDTSEQLHFEVSGNILLVACKEEKILPANVVKKECQNRLAALEAKEQRDEMWFISNSFRVQKSSYGSQSDMLRTDKESFRLGHYFATEEDAQAWLDAMRNSRR